MYPPLITKLPAPRPPPFAGWQEEWDEMPYARLLYITPAKAVEAWEKYCAIGQQGEARLVNDAIAAHLSLPPLLERLALLDAEITRTRPAATLYQRWRRGQVPHPGKDTANDAGYYSRQVSERTLLRKKIASIKDN